MKGYLSRIARQSGIRFPEPRVAPGMSRDAQDADPVAPELEQRVLIAPEATERGEERVKKDTRPPERPAAAVLEKRIHTVASGSATPARVESHEHPVETPKPRERSRVTDVAIPRPAGMPLESATRVIGQPVAPAVERKAFRDPPAKASAREGHSEPRQPEVLDSTAASRSAGPAAVPREFFARTAELLSGDAVTAANPQDILLREVQEWVAASSVEPPAAAPAPAVRDLSRMVTASLPRAPASTLIRENRQVDQPPRPEPHPLEQKLDLSIGTIDVIIEEAGQPRAPEPRSARPEPTTATRPGRGSRLRRGYL